MTRKTPRRRRVAGQITLAARLLTTALAERLRPLGLAPAQFHVLQELWEEGALTQRDLGLLVGVEQATMAATLNRMERDGLITRHKHPEDDRARLIQPTERACALERPTFDVVSVLDAEAMAVLDPAERATLAELLGRVLAGLVE